MAAKIQFQFLYGTIIRRDAFSKLGHNAISIPLWYDYKLQKRAKTGGIIQFQFLYGTIIREQEAAI